MPYQLLADTVLVVHALFIVFAVLGGLLVLRWRQLLWLHLPCVAWVGLGSPCAHSAAGSHS